MEFWKEGALEAGADGPRVILMGELDLASVDIAEAALRTAEQAEGAPEVVLDLEQLTFIDSTGISWLVATMRRHSLDGDRLRATGTTPAVHRVFEITGIADRLPQPDGSTAPRDMQTPP